jgi:hypothetical protein
MTWFTEGAEFCGTAPPDGAGDPTMIGDPAAMLLPVPEAELPDGVETPDPCPEANPTPPFWAVDEAVPNPEAWPFPAEPVPAPMASEEPKKMGCDGRNCPVQQHLNSV